jgi:DNA-binding LacI/PurR family transcriptional regulator
VTRTGVRKPAKLSDVAALAEVSKATVSNVFNKPALVRSELRIRVLEAAKALGYCGPNPMGRLLSAGKVNAIGVATVEPLSCFFQDPFARCMMVGVSEECQSRGIGLSLVSAATEDELAWNIRSAVVDGLILFCLEGAERLIALARERHLPFVALSLSDADRGISAVGIDDRAGARLAAEYLVGLGHRRFAMLAMEFAADHAGPVTMDRVRAATYAPSRDRVEGYFDALSAAGIDTGGVPIFETHGDTAIVDPAMQAVFAAPEPPTAILAQSDRIAFRALDWLRAKGIVVPGAVSVIGFDGVPESAVSRPPLTTVRQPIEEIGRRAVQLVLDHGEEARRERLEVELVVRGSTAPPPGLALSRAAR